MKICFCIPLPEVTSQLSCFLDATKLCQLLFGVYLDLFVSSFKPGLCSCAAKKQGAMSLDGFQIYLCSQEGSIFKPELRELHQDMSQPLSHYFISSSHNTYLLEDQLRGQSSLEAYIQ